MANRIDPVCGKQVEQNAATTGALFSRYGNHLYYFCSLRCRQTFDQDPAARSAATDVVCRERVTIGEAEERECFADQGTRRYYFCSEACRKKFALAPEFYSQLHAEDQHTRLPGPDVAR